MKYNNLLLVSGSGRDSGKTTLICKVIGQFTGMGIMAVKISPHFHNPSEGLIHISGGTGFDIYEETSLISTKDSSRMLRSGAKKVFYVQSKEEEIMNAFLQIYESIPSGHPVICESPALLKYLEPGLFIMMTAPEIQNQKAQHNIMRLPDLEYKIDELATVSLPIGFKDGKWISIK